MRAVLFLTERSHRDLGMREVDALSMGRDQPEFEDASFLERHRQRAALSPADRQTLHTRLRRPDGQRLATAIESAECDAAVGSAVRFQPLYDRFGDDHPTIEREQHQRGFNSHVGRRRTVSVTKFERESRFALERDDVRLRTWVAGQSAMRQGKA